jgi:hypothetical protein
MPLAPVTLHCTNGSTNCSPLKTQRMISFVRYPNRAAFLVSQPPNLAEPAADEQIGARIGRYKLLEQIGEGGMGVVYMAEQEVPVRRKVALKIIKLGMDTRQVVARFEAERQALALMDHPNIAKVLDGGVTDTGARLSPAAARPIARDRDSFSQDHAAGEVAAAEDSRAPYLSAAGPTSS